MMRDPGRARAYLPSLPGTSPVLAAEVNEASHNVLDSRIGRGRHPACRRPEQDPLSKAATFPPRSGQAWSLGV